MAFPGSKKGATEARAPILVTATGSVPIPAGARVLHAFIVGGGGSGGGVARVNTSFGAAGGGGQGGSLYIRIDLRLYVETPVNDFPQRSSRPQVVSLTIGAGGTARTAGTAQTWQAGNAGGTTSISLDGGFSASVSGGTGGGGNAGIASGGGFGSSPVTYAPNNWTSLDAVWVRPFSPVGMQTTNISQLSTANGGGADPTNAGAEVGYAGASTTSMSLPWWLRAVGITTLGSGGTGTQAIGLLKAAGGGAGGFGGNGGNAAVSSTGAATGGAGGGYGSGGGGAVGLDGFTSSSGAGAPGCAVIMFEVEV